MKDFQTGDLIVVENAIISEHNGRNGVITAIANKSETWYDVHVRLEGDDYTTPFYCNEIGRVQ